MASVEVKKVWYRCPNCGKKLLKYDEKEGICKKIFIKCKQCKKEVEINNPLLYGNLKYSANNIKTLNVIDKNGNKITIPNSPSLEMRITHKNGKKYLFYFDTIILENDTLKGSRSRFIPNLTRKIPFDSIAKIEVQEGGKNYNYQN